MSKVLSLSFVAALCAASSFGDIRAVTPTAWNGDPNCWQMKRHHEKMASVTNGGAKVVFIGDSITHFWESNGKVQLAKYFSEGDLKMLDLGTSADRTEHVLWRLMEGKELDGYEAKVVFLMIGTNNSGHFPFAQEPPTDAILGIREIVKTIRAKQPNALLVLTSIFPRGADASDPCRRRNDVVNREIRRFADGKDILWLDMDGVFAAADGTLSRNVFPDLLHPSAVGYEMWYAALRPYLEHAFSDRKIPFGFTDLRPRCTSEEPKEPKAVCPVTRIRSEGYGKFDWWLDRLLRNRNEIAEAKGEIDLVFFGDSITHNWENSGKESLAELRKTYSVLDIGYSGDCTEHLLWRGENGELDGYKAKCIMLMIGTNNTWHRNDKPEDTAEGIKRILALIAKKQPQAKVLLLPIFPFGNSFSDPKRAVNDKVNAIIKGFADGKQVVWVDFTSKFLDEKGDNTKWMPDNCHPNAAGYREIWLPGVLPYFKEACGK